tara:strand:+ start:52968 stop:53183 length:216 start_codon:yes stop_codon:yes gene_type:complete
MIEVTPDQEDHIVVESLNRALNEFEQQMEDRRTGRSIIALFHHNPVVDMKECQDHIDAFRKVLTYYEPQSL